MHSNYNLLTLSDSRLLNSNGQMIYYKERIEGRNMKITDTIKYVGVNDHQVDLFEGQYAVPNGMAYNSYVILDDKVAVMDTVDANFKDEWLENVAKVLDGAKPDYLVVQHMEPDHAANIENFMKAYPDTTVVANTKTFTMMGNFFRNLNLDGKKLVVANGDSLTLGKHVLTFVFAPMVHWPEVMVTYDSTDKVLFSADGFGKFGALDVEEDWDCEARRYYIGIVGKYGAQVQKLLKAAATLDIQTICPLHGPILTENLGHYLEKYDIWSSYKVESEGVVIAYTSVYGNTKKAAETLASALEAKGCPKVVLCDLAREGKTVERKARKIKILKITIDQIALPFVTMTVTCSKGTYIRTLCHDIGEKLGCGGCMESLLRTRVSSFTLKDSLKLPEIEKLQESGKIEQILMPVDAVFMQYPCVSILEEQEKILRNGNPFRVREIQNLLPEGQNVDELEKDRIRVYDTGGQFCAIYEYREEKGMFFPVKMFL